MKSSSLFRLIFLAIVAVFILNLVILLVYFPLSTPASPSSYSFSALTLLSLKTKKHGSFGKPGNKNLRNKYLHHQQRPPLRADDEQQQEQEPGRNQTTKEVAFPIAKNDTKKTTKCPPYGCPLYPPELTADITNQTIRKALESSGLMMQASSKSEDLLSEFRFEFASNSFAMLSQKGKSHTVNQDRGVFISPFLPSLLSSAPTSSRNSTTKSFLTCIFDGHGDLGHEVAQEVMVKFPLLLSEKLNLALRGEVNNGISRNMRYKKTRNNQNNDSTMNEVILVQKEDHDSTDFAVRKALNETFLELNGKGTSPKFLLGGCTASVALRWGSKLYIANVGDSETIVVSASPSSQQQKLTTNNQQQQKSFAAKVEYNTRRDKANQPDERARIEKLGGKIHINAKGFDPRVILYSQAAKDTVGLAMSRSIGDWEWKTVGVTAEPTIDLLDISKALASDSNEMFFLLAASDGFWDLRQKQFYATQLAASFSKSNNSSQNSTDSGDINAAFRPLYHLHAMIQKITPKAQEGYRDDITAVIVNLE